MAHSTHGKVSAPTVPTRSRARGALIWFIVLSGLAALIGVLALWPNSARENVVRGGVPLVAAGASIVHGELASVRPACASAGADATRCGPSAVILSDGQRGGQKVGVELTPDVLSTGLRVGDRVQILREVDPTTDQPTYTFYRAERGGSLLWLAGLFALAVVLVAWRRGVAALLSLGFAGLVTVGFLLPALLSGQPAIPTVLSGAALILIVMLYATHGFSLRTSVALGGALAGLGLSAGMAWLAVSATHLGGLGDDTAALLVNNVPWVNVQQLIAASVIFAGIGTLNDVTVTQASALWELRAASTKLTRRGLFQSAMRIGRDHVASTVYTLVFAYLGTALVLLVAVQVYSGSPIDFLTAEDIAQEIVRALVGGIALLLAMPLTTALGALVIKAPTAAQRGARSKIK